MKLTKHALERYIERVKPLIDVEAAEREVSALIRECPGPVDEVSFHTPSIEAEVDAYLELAPGIALVLARNGSLWDALTLVVRGSNHPDVRKAKTERKRRRRAARRLRQKNPGKRTEEAL